MSRRRGGEEAAPSARELARETSPGAETRRVLTERLRAEGRTISLDYAFELGIVTNEDWCKELDRQRELAGSRESSQDNAPSREERVAREQQRYEERAAAAYAERRGRR